MAREVRFASKANMLERQRECLILGPVQITPVLVPHDCSDGFLYAYWRRPAAYLDGHIQSGSSSFWAISNAEPELQRLKQDIETGEWERRYADLLTLDAYDAGYRLVVAN